MTSYPVHRQESMDQMLKARGVHGYCSKNTDQNNTQSLDFIGIRRTSDGCDQLEIGGGSRACSRLRLSHWGLEMSGECTLKPLTELEMSLLFVALHFVLRDLQKDLGHCVVLVNVDGHDCWEIVGVSCQKAPHTTLLNTTAHRQSISLWNRLRYSIKEFSFLHHTVEITHTLTSHTITHHELL